ncbi:MAG: ATP synthase F1 subunit gamma [Clostridia bacterium]|nr:ATP synthase F1 subunit gamma [Clostridia bacterium]
MAGANMKAIKSRIKSVESTRQITKAMELVASSKLRRAKQQEEAVKPYYSMLLDTIRDIVRVGCERHPLINAKPEATATCYVVIAGDRGLAGGYNNNLFRLVREQIKDGDCVIPVGKKSVDYYSKQSYAILSTDFMPAADVGIAQSHEIGSIVCQAFRSGKVGRVVVAYTEFASMLSQIPKTLELFPLERDVLRAEQTKKTGREEMESEKLKLQPDTIYEPSPEAVLETVIPQYVSGMIFGAVCEAAASEFAARRTAMNAANKNADAMISDLTLRYNRARQAMITQEITEIIAGSEAL